MTSPEDSSARSGWQRYDMLRPRLLASLAAGAAFTLLVTDGQSLSVRLLVGWDAAVLCYAVLIVTTFMSCATPESMRRRAQTLDAGRWLMLAASSMAAATSLAAVASLLGNVHGLPPGSVAWHVALAAFTIVASWIFLHGMYALDYAHGYYYRADHTDRSRPPAGLGFPGDTHPDYWDFLYFSFVVGMTCQVSDVTVQSKPMRQLVLVHGVLAFFFNTVVLALAINITASLI
jgi:uncharacterized membrane protein